MFQANAFRKRNFPASSGPRLWKRCCCCILSPTEESRRALPLPRVHQNRCQGSVGAGLGELQSCWCPPVWWQWPARQGQPARGRAGVGTTVDTMMPWIHRESPQPLAEGPAGIPTGEMEGVAAWQTLCPAAPSSCPRRVLGEGLPCRSRQGPRPPASVHYRWSLSGCWSCRKRRHESAAMDFFLTGADPSGLLFITCSRRSYCSYSKSFYNDLSL